MTKYQYILLLVVAFWSGRVFQSYAFSDHKGQILDATSTVAVVYSTHCVRTAGHGEGVVIETLPVSSEAEWQADARRCDTLYKQDAKEGKLNY